MNQSLYQSKSHVRVTTKKFILTILAMAFLAANMRTPIVTLGPISPVVQEALSINQAQIGWLGSIPVMMFAFGAFVSPKLSKRFGIENMLIAAITLLAIGIILRVSVIHWWWFFIGTTLLSLAIGFANTLAAPAIKLLAPDRIPLVTGVLSLTMAIVAGVSAGAVVPMTEKFGWQWALGSWSVLSVIALVIWIFLKRLDAGSFNGSDEADPECDCESKSNFKFNKTIDRKAIIDENVETGVKQSINEPLSNNQKNYSDTPIWKFPMAWCVAIFMGLQSLLFYTLASFLPSILISKGLPAIEAGKMFSLFLLVAPFSIVFLTWAMRHPSWVPYLAMASAVFNFFGIAGVAYLPVNLSWLWLCSTGFGGTMLFTLCSMLISMRTYTTDQASNLSGMAQTVGYIIAIVGPLGTGWLHEVTDSWQLPLHLLSVLMLLNIVFAYFASRHQMIDGHKIDLLNQ